jgi:CBS domain-containing protein
MRSCSRCLRKHGACRGDRSVYSIEAGHLGVVVEDDQREPVDILLRLRVVDAMTKVMLAFPPEASVLEIAIAFEADPDPLALLLSEEGELDGIVTSFDVSEALAEGRETATTAEIGSTDLRTIHAGETLHAALGIFAPRGIRMLPVVGRGAEGRRPQALLRRSGITQAYPEGVEHGVAQTREQRLAPIRGSDEVRYLDLRMGRENGLNGKLLPELELTEDTVIVAVRRDGMARPHSAGRGRPGDGDRDSRGRSGGAGTLREALGARRQHTLGRTSAVQSAARVRGAGVRLDALRAAPPRQARKTLGDDAADLGAGGHAAARA